MAVVLVVVATIISMNVSVRHEQHHNHETPCVGVSWGVVCWVLEGTVQGGTNMCWEPWRQGGGGGGGRMERESGEREGERSGSWREKGEGRPGKEAVWRGLGESERGQRKVGALNN